MTQPIMTKRVCKICSKEFLAKPYLVRKNFANYCSSICYHKSGIGINPWNKGLKYENLKARTGKYIICKVCGNNKYFELNQLKKRPCLYCSVKCARKTIEKDNLKYSSLHSWIKRVWNSTKVCAYCLSDKNVDFANISHDYKKDIDDWMPLCRKHHMAFDKGKIKLLNQIPGGVYEWNRDPSFISLRR